MKTMHPARQRLRSMLRQPDAPLNLAEAALCIAWEDRGWGDPDASLAQLDRLGQEARALLEGVNQPEAQVACLNQLLFEHHQFRGNTWSYGDPANSYLDQVLESHAGLPITLALVYLEVARRASLPIVGVALPGHFIVRYLDADRSIFIDPFHQGRRWSMNECLVQVRLFYGSVDETLMQSILTPPTAHQILVRMLRNLKAAYAQHEEYQRALNCVERILLIEPDCPEELRDRGLLRMRLGQQALALEDLDAYAQRAPTASDMETIRKRALQIAALFGRLN